MINYKRLAEFQEPCVLRGRSRASELPERGSCAEPERSSRNRSPRTIGICVPEECADGHLGMDWFVGIVV